jgi:hypothetical protein
MVKNDLIAEVDELEHRVIRKLEVWLSPSTKLAVLVTYIGGIKNLNIDQVYL